MVRWGGIQNMHHGDVALNWGHVPSWHVVHSEATMVWQCGTMEQGGWQAIHHANFEIKKR